MVEEVGTKRITLQILCQEHKSPTKHTNPPPSAIATASNINTFMHCKNALLGFLP